LICWGGNYLVLRSILRSTSTLGELRSSVLHRVLLVPVIAMSASDERPKMRGKKARPPYTHDVDKNAKYFYLGQKNVGSLKEFNF
jgi:hypothetical protein